MFISMNIVKCTRTMFITMNIVKCTRALTSDNVHIFMRVGKRISTFSKF